MSIEIYAEVVELRKLPRDVIEIALSMERPVKQPSVEDAGLEEVEELIPQPIMKFFKRAVERLGNYSPPDIVLRVDSDHYNAMGRPVIGDRMRIILEKMK